MTMNMGSGVRSVRSSHGSDDEVTTPPKASAGLATLAIAAGSQPASCSWLTDVEHSGGSSSITAGRRGPATHGGEAIEESMRRLIHGTTFQFIDVSPAEALETAREAAGGKDVRIGGGPTVIRDFLAAGLVDHLHTVVVPILLGRGVRLW